MENEKTANKPKNRWILIIAMVIAVVLLFFSLKDISWNEVWRTIVGAKFGLLLAGLGITLVNLFFRGIRWGVLLSAEQKISPVTMFWAASVGYLGNMTLPARAGEVIRSAALSRKTGLSLGYIFATALTERILDVLILVFIAILSVKSLPNLPDWMGNAMVVMSILAGFALIFLVVAPRFERMLNRIIQMLPFPIKWKDLACKFINRFLTGGKAFVHPVRAGGFLGFSAVIWLLDGVIGILIGKALGLNFSLAQVMLFLVGLGLSSAVPSTPGYVGVYQFVAVTLLPMFGVTKSQALSFMLILQATSVIIVVIFGLLGTWQLGIRRLNKKAIKGEVE